MPNPSGSGVTGDPWHECGVCGRWWRTSALTKQKGVLKCPDDVDDLTVEQRERELRTILNSGPDAPLADILVDPTPADLEYEI